MKKDEALDKFKNMIIESWTYNKMTKKEQTKFLKILQEERTQKALKGNFNHRWSILQAIYGTYLYGLGYENFNWREEVE